MSDSFDILQGKQKFTYQSYIYFVSSYITETYYVTQPIDDVRKFYPVDDVYSNIIIFLIPYWRHWYRFYECNTQDAYTITTIDKWFNHEHS